MFQLWSGYAVPAFYVLILYSGKYDHLLKSRWLSTLLHAAHLSRPPGSFGLTSVLGRGWRALGTPNADLGYPPYPTKELRGHEPATRRALFCSKQPYFYNISLPKWTESMNTKHEQSAQPKLLSPLIICIALHTLQRLDTTQPGRLFSLQWCIGKLGMSGIILQVGRGTGEPLASYLPIFEGSPFTLSFLYTAWTKLGFTKEQTDRHLLWTKIQGQVN